jgi:hypothetical protein
VSSEFGSEISGYIKGEKFLDNLSDFQLFKKDSVPHSQLATWF